MSLEITNFAELEPIQAHEIASKIQDYTFGLTAEKPQMIAATQEEIFAKLAGQVAMLDGTFVGYIGAAPALEWQGQSMTEVGTLWVVSNARKMGIATKLTESIVLDVTAGGYVPYAFCNNLSKPIFAAVGFTEATEEQIPASAFGLCGKCPAKPLKGCCDTTMIYQGANQ